MAEMGPEEQRASHEMTMEMVYGRRSITRDEHESLEAWSDADGMVTNRLYQWPHGGAIAMIGAGAFHFFDVE